jgi:hypothetical protein
MGDSYIVDTPYLVEGQTGAEVLVNEGISRLETFAVLKLTDRLAGTPPGSPVNGRSYHLGTSPTGDWSGHGGEIASYYDGWLFTGPHGGMVAFVDDEKIWMVYSSTDSKWWPIGLDVQKVFYVTQIALDTPPGSPAEHDVYVIGPTPSGAWASNANDIAYYFNGVWVFVDPLPGATIIYDKNTDAWWGYNKEETLWHPLQKYYSTTEQWTGKYHNSNKVYGKLLQLADFPSSGSKTYAHSITSFDYMVAHEAWATDLTDEIPIPYVDANLIYLKVDATNVTITVTSDRSAFDGWIFLEYTKT